MLVDLGGILFPMVKVISILIVWFVVGRIVDASLTVLPDDTFLQALLIIATNPIIPVAGIIITIAIKVFGDRA
jgi:hypothetical protein